MTASNFGWSGGGLHGMALLAEPFDHSPQQLRLVLDDQNARHLACPWV
jgi:hypothetical protein